MTERNAFIKSTAGVVITNDDGSIANDQAGERHRNFETDDRIVEAIFNDSIRGSYNASSRSHITKSVGFMRPGPLRYIKQDELLFGHPDWYMRNDGAFDQYYYVQNHSSMSVDLRRWRRYYYGPQTGDYPTTDRSTAFGAFGFVQNQWEANIPARGNGENRFFPEVQQLFAIVSWIDVPGTQIGNIFKHLPGSTAWYNVSGQTALSQGAIEIEGVFDPPENMLDHYGYQIYYTKAGGAGRPGDAANADLTAAIDGVAGSVTTSSSVFTDGAAQGLFLVGVHDQGNHYIRITASTGNSGTFLITAVNSVDTVTVDDVAINEAFATEGSLTWEMVSGPVGEYFWRRKVDHSYEYWSTSETYNYGVFPLYNIMAHEILQCWDQRTPPMRTMHDRGACWWGCLARNDSTLKEGRLFRYVHMSPQAYEPMNDDSKWSGTWPESQGAYTDMNIDDQNKMWLSARGDGTFAPYPLIRFDPYPGGNSLTPQHLTNFFRQTDNADAGGLASADLWGVLADESHAYAAGTRIWVFGGLDEDLPSDEGGHSYTDDYGATWKRLHYLTTITGTASVSNGTAAVTGAGTNFTTELAVGDWMRFSGDSRSYEILTIADDLNLTLASNHATGASAVTIERGALTLDESRIYGNSSVGNGSATEYSHPSACDYDSDGNVYWIPNGRGSLVKWDESAGATSHVTIAQMSTQAAVGAGQIKHVACQRIPNPHGPQDHPLHNMLWVGTRQEGMIAVWPVFDGTNTRYRWDLADNWPLTVDIPSGTGIANNMIAKLEPTTGVMALHITYQASGPPNTALKLTVNQQNNGLGNTRIGLLTNNSSAAGGANSWTQYSERMALASSRYDDLGMGRKWDLTCSYYASNETTSTRSGLGAGPFICWRWTGAAWVKGPVNSINGHLYFSEVGDPTFSMPNIDYPVSVGSGVKRMHADFQDLDPDMGMRVRFVEATIQATDQDQQFLIDETSTFSCFIGVGKDNTQEARYFTDMYIVPTLLRENYETVKNVRNMWSQDGGIDGGHTLSSSSAVWPSFTRGVAELSYHATRSDTGTPYTNLFYNYRFNTPSRYKQFMGALRIKPEGEFAGDGSVTAAGVNFVSAGAHVFVPGDVGKSIIVEGVNGAAVDVDNGQAVIMSWVSGTEVVTDKTFAATTGSLRWKLMDIPAVSYVVGFWEYMYMFHGTTNSDWRLYSSDDRGVNWDQVKVWLNHNGSTPNAPDWTYLHDPGVYFSDNTFMRGSVQIAATDPIGSTAIIFDLTDLPENVRRRQHWKIYTFDSQNNAQDMRGISSLHLLDANRQPLGLPASAAVDDKDDPLFDGSFILSAHMRVLTGANNASAVDDGDGDAYTNLVTMPGESFYTQSGSNNAQLSGNDFIGGTWVPEDVGKFIRVINAVNSENEGWALVTDYVSGGQVTTDKAFTAETNTFDWQALEFGENDLLKLIDPVSNPTYGQSAAVRFFSIADVPTASTIALVDKELPVSLAGVPFVINRIVPDGSNYGNAMTAGGAGADTLQRVFTDVQPGSLQYSLPLEFLVLEENLGAPSATSGVDSDGDGRVDTVVLPTSIVPEAVAGDMLMLDGTGGRRMWEMKTITRDSPAPGQTTVVLTYDELHPSGSFTWQIYRHRGLLYDANRVLYFLKESTP
jgi:hypothetical protein